ncbi:MAG: outer membrane beta-barrel protein [Edaphocola sp.]
MTKKNFLRNSNNHLGLTEGYYKFHAKVCLQGEFIGTYCINRKISVMSGIGLGLSNNGILFHYQTSELETKQVISANVVYLLIPINIYYNISKKTNIISGVSIKYNTDFERNYSTNFNMTKPTTYNYSINSPFVNDFWSCAFDCSIGYSISEHIKLIATGSIDFTNRYPIMEIENTLDVNSIETIYAYKGRPKVYQIGIGFSYKLFSFGNRPKAVSTYSCPQF